MNRVGNGETRKNQRFRQVYTGLENHSARAQPAHSEFKSETTLTPFAEHAERLVIFNATVRTETQAQTGTVAPETTGLPRTEELKITIGGTEEIIAEIEMVEPTSRERIAEPGLTLEVSLPQEDNHLTGQTGTVCGVAVLNTYI